MSIWWRSRGSMTSVSISPVLILLVVSFIIALCISLLAPTRDTDDEKRPGRPPGPSEETLGD
jgi:hypothetical protein